ncbi:MAG TPA: sigma-70 family RNA polymerase sigma factor [Kofleriaceae bacterium]|nr:sigma-70 family RNA polymerase sigma factor [Kofleriaceae bacterium]
MIDRAQLTAWMTAASEGERAALDPLFAALWPVVHAYALRFLGDRALAEDVAQDTLVGLFGQLERYDRTRDALTWALTHATWQCRTARRRVVRGKLDGDDGLAATLVVDGRQLADERELARAALATLAGLPARDIEVIAAALDGDDELRAALAPATFRKRLERALGRLRLAWRSRHDTP